MQERENAMSPPELTFPSAEAEFLKKVYERAQVILEYGSGGSTALAAALPGKFVFSVESDPRFLCRLNTYLMQLRSGGRTITYHVDIGPVGKWGRPTDSSGWQQYPGYARAIWQEDFFLQPDTVLIDGRFRVACFLACAALTRTPLTVLFDDYTPRREYHAVERVSSPIDRIGRMAVFQVQPGSLDADALLDFLPYFYDPA